MLDISAVNMRLSILPLTMCTHCDMLGEAKCCEGCLEMCMHHWSWYH